MARAGNKFGITTEIRGLLLDNERLTQLVGDKVFPISAEKDTEGDFITYQRDGYFVERNKMGVHDQSCKLFVCAVSDDYARSVKLADLIYTILDGEFTDPDMTIHLEDSTEDSVDGKFIQILLFSIT